jgi:hypothetical protein
MGTTRDPVDCAYTDQVLVRDAHDQNMERGAHDNPRSAGWRCRCWGACGMTMCPRENGPHDHAQL